jgi:hypothetical protein
MSSRNEKRVGKEKQEVNFEEFTIFQDFEAMAGVRKEILTVPVRGQGRI